MKITRALAPVALLLSIQGVVSTHGLMQFAAGLAFFLSLDLTLRSRAKPKPSLDDVTYEMAITSGGFLHESATDGEIRTVCRLRVRTAYERLQTLEAALARILGDDWREIVSCPTIPAHDPSTGSRENRGQDSVAWPDRAIIGEDRSSRASFS